MPKLSEQTQQARRERILDAAERCFVQRGFHRTSMQDICREAGISPGALYIYFASKEDSIAGICERETLQFAEHLELMSEAPDFMTALRTLADTYCFDQPRSKLQLHIEIGAEMIRNEKVSARVLEVDRFVQERFTSHDRAPAAGGPHRAQRGQRRGGPRPAHDGRRAVLELARFIRISTRRPWCPR